jgi:hypothetical protein
MTRRWIGGALIAVTGICGSARAQYTDNLADVATIPKALRPMVPLVAVGDPQYQLRHEPKSIGDLGHLDFVVDMRGFVPFSHASRTITNPYIGRWYKIPTKKALLVFYTGALSLDQIAENTTDAENKAWAGTRFLTERDVHGEPEQWCKVAYDLAGNDAKQLFDKLVGGDFISAEPTTLLFTEQSVFVLLNFKYELAARGDGGQVLMALEFSRASRRYKTVYTLYSTTLFNKGTESLLAASAPYVMRIVVAAFGQQE